MFAFYPFSLMNIVLTSSRPCRPQFFTLVLLIIVAEIASIVWIHMNREKLRQELKDSIAGAVREEYGRVSRAAVRE